MHIYTSNSLGAGGYGFLPEYYFSSPPLRPNKTCSVEGGEVGSRLVCVGLNPKKTGGPWWPPPLDILHDYSAMREALAATLYDNFLSSFPHILTPNLWWPGYGSEVM